MNNVHHSGSRPVRKVKQGLIMTFTNDYVSPRASEKLKDAGSNLLDMFLGFSEKLLAK